MDIYLATLLIVFSADLKLGKFKPVFLTLLFLLFRRRRGSLRCFNPHDHSRNPYSNCIHHANFEIPSYPQARFDGSKCLAYFDFAYQLLHCHPLLAAHGVTIQLNRRFLPRLDFLVHRAFLSFFLDEHSFILQVNLQLHFNLVRRADCISSFRQNFLESLFLKTLVILFLRLARYFGLTLK